ncbi:MAG: nuclear transport factor 2 family protein [Beijerinckiaceae bacterium]|nr:nuclear transport factor 2 family protein [Beijerinckiaceae bacterium]MCZ8301805.1 nuclear transport factor 2 family protein [Beijerinckiaceae bacterium]
MSAFQQSFPFQPSAAVVSSGIGQPGWPKPGCPSLSELLQFTNASHVEAIYTRSCALFEALQSGAIDAVRAAYLPEAVLEHPVLGGLHGPEIDQYWATFLKRTPDFVLDFTITHVVGSIAVAEWSAAYTFFETGRPMRLAGLSVLTLQDGLVKHHEERFDRRAWSYQALGLSGLLISCMPGSRSFLRQEARRAFGIDAPQT